MIKSIPAPYDAFEHLCHIILPEDRSNQIIGMFTGYFDESGTHASSPVVCVGGCVSTAEQWSLFQREWNEVLAEAGVEVFHMSEFESRRGPYKDWDNEKRRYVQAKLLKIIQDRVKVGIAVSVVRSDYDKVMTPGRRYTHDGPYAFCASMCFMYTAAWAEDKGYDQSIPYVFEDGVLERKELRDQFENAYKNARARQYYRLKSLTWGDKKEYVQLQAADILVYEIYKQTLRSIGVESRPPRTSMLILDKLPMKRRCLDESDLSKIMSILESGSR
jgi:hypothetical protein